MRRYCILAAFLGSISLSQGQDISSLFGDVRAVDAPLSTLDYVRAHPMEEESAKLDDMLEDLTATRRAIAMSQPSRVPQDVKDFETELDKIKWFAKSLRPATRSFRRNMEEPNGVGKQLDTILDIFKVSIENVFDTIAKMMPNTTPIINILRMYMKYVFG